MLRVETLEEAEAAERAGVDMASVPPELIRNPAFRDAAPSVFAIPGADFVEIGTTDDFIRWAFAMVRASADAVYCSASLKTVKALSDEGIPVCGHSGLIPSKRTWTGGFRAVGKTLETAQSVYQQIESLEAAGAFAAEIEGVPEPIAMEIMECTSLILISMGAGNGGHAQYLFSEDVLGSNRGHIPRHAKTYRNFAAEYARLQEERVAAYGEYVHDVQTGAYPGEGHKLTMDDHVTGSFRQWLNAKHDREPSEQPEGTALEPGKR